MESIGTKILKIEWNTLAGFGVACTQWKKTREQLELLCLWQILTRRWRRKRLQCWTSFCAILQRLGKPCKYIQISMRDLSGARKPYSPLSCSGLFKIISAFLGNIRRWVVIWPFGFVPKQTKPCTYRLDLI